MLTRTITLLGFRNLLLDFPRRGCYVGLETQSPDNLLERRIIALGGDRLRGDEHFRRVRNVSAIYAPQAQARLRYGMQQP